MKKSITKTAIAAAMATTLILSGAVSAHAADLYLAVMAREGLTLNFVAADSNRKALFYTPGNGISHRSAQGWYFQKLPSDFDVSKMGHWCARVMEPDELFGESVCSEVDADDLPEDGIFKLVLDL